MRFSEREGLSPPPMPLEPESMPDTLRNRLWSVVCARLVAWSETDELGDRVPGRELYKLWDEFYKQPVDTLPPLTSRVLEQLRAEFFRCRWNAIYDLIEFLAGLESRGRLAGPKSFAERVNDVLEQELAAWRFIGPRLQRVTDRDEMASIQEATQSPVAGVRLHIRSALACLAQRPTPDTRNTIKEAVSAVESAAKSVTGRESDVFTALAQRLTADGAHPQFVQAWKNLYNYTSDAGGVRHGAKDGDAVPSVDEAKLFVITASAFTNYLVAHYGSRLGDSGA